ncbi:MAG: glycosyltransferase [Deltaproteobacteria bacterium]|nr:glycosyltransferase [Deltaproteobacteria bacterium]
MAELAGSLMSDVNVFNSRWCREMLFDNAAKYLSAAMVERLEASSMLINYGTIEPEIKPECTGNEIPVIAYNHRLLTHKHWKDTFTVLDDLYRQGIKFRLRFMNNCAEKVAKIRHYPFVEIILSRSREEYLRALRGCDLNVINSRHETFCIAAAESMAMGQPLVAPDGVTFTEITGKDEIGYPYLFKSPAQQRQHLKKLLTNSDERWKWGKRLSEYVRARYTMDVWAASYVKLFERLVADIHIGTSQRILAKVAEMCKRYNGKPLTEMYSGFSRKHGYVDGKQMIGTQTATLTKLLRLIRHVGHDVVIRGGEEIVCVKTKT